MGTDLINLLEDVSEDFKDLSFSMAELSQTEDGSTSFVARAVLDGHPVGLRIILGNKWETRTLGGSAPVFWGHVTYQSIGEESDRLIRAIGTLYAIEKPGSRMKPEVRFSAVALEGNPGAYPPVRIRMKLFVNAELEEEYAEVFTNFDSESQWIGIREKDADYREPVYAALVAEAGL